MHSQSRQEFSDTTTQLARFEAHAEVSKTHLTRVLHDDFGGLLVAAIMDTAWAEQHLIDCPKIRERLSRVRECLAAAIDLKRNMIESLRPSLLENFGLFAALRWYHKHNCESAGISCTEAYPDEEPPFTDEASTALFRIVQEGLANVSRHKSAKNAHLDVHVDNAELSILVEHDGDILTIDRMDSEDHLSKWLLGHRVAALGGNVTFMHPAAGGMTLRAQIPLRNVLVSKRKARLSRAARG
jgi:signal transduction histidine kinase